MSARNKVVSKIEAQKSEIEAVIDMIFDKVIYDNTKALNSFNMRISALTSNKPYFPY